MGKQTQRDRISAGATSHAPLVLPLDSFRRTDLAIAGGKGANLGELIHAGFPVPAGFVVTTVAYDRFVTYNHLDRMIFQTLHEQPGNGTVIREAFEVEAVLSAVRRCFAALMARMIWSSKQRSILKEELS